MWDFSFLLILFFLCSLNDIYNIMTCEGLLLAVNPFIFIHRVCLSADLSPDEVVWLDKLAGPLVSYTLRGLLPLIRNAPAAVVVQPTWRKKQIESRGRVNEHFRPLFKPKKRYLCTEIYSYCTQQHHLTMYFTLLRND